MTEKEEKTLLTLARSDRGERDEAKAIALVFIARQLTRIADQGERLKTAEMLLCRIDKTNFTSCVAKGDFLHISVPSSLTREIHRFCETVDAGTFGAAMQTHNQDYNPPPAPDVPTVALVEAVDFADLSERATRVYEFILGLKSTEGMERLEPLRDIDEIRSMVRLVAEADHEKAVG